MNKHRFTLLPAVLFLLSVFPCQDLAHSQQAPASPASAAPAAQPSHDVEQPARPAATPSAAAGKESKADAPSRPYKLGPAEKEKLFASVEEVLRFASQDTLLPIKHSVKKAVVSR